jgi:CheY-like chemotaxis protein
MRILLVEDEALKRRTLLRMIGAVFPAAEVATAADAQAAAAELHGGWFDLVVTDWCFPLTKGGSAVTGAGRDVVAVCRAIGVPVLIASGHGPQSGFETEWLPDWRPVTLRRYLPSRLRA